MKFLVPNYSCLQNPWLRGYRPQIPVLSVLNWICWTPSEKNSWVRHWLNSLHMPSWCGQDNFACFILNLWMWLPLSDMYSNKWYCSNIDVSEAGGVPQSVLGGLRAVQLLTELQETSDETDCARGCQWTQRKWQILSEWTNWWNSKA